MVWTCVRNVAACERSGADPSRPEPRHRLRSRHHPRRHELQRGHCKWRLFHWQERTVPDALVDLDGRIRTLAWRHSTQVLRVVRNRKRDRRPVRSLNPLALRATRDLKRLAPAKRLRSLTLRCVGLRFSPAFTPLQPSGAGSQFVSYVQTAHIEFLPRSEPLLAILCNRVTCLAVLLHLAQQRCPSQALSSAGSSQRELCFTFLNPGLGPLRHGLAASRAACRSL